jgi:nitrate reductase NapE component
MLVTICVLDRYSDGSQRKCAHAHEGARSELFQPLSLLDGIYTVLSEAFVGATGGLCLCKEYRPQEDVAGEQFSTNLCRSISRPPIPLTDYSFCVY